jgi:hypothetical protein
MTTKVYGQSDDLIEFEGDVNGEVGCYGTDDRDKGVLVSFSDGTLLEVKYGKDSKGIWEIKLKERGALLDRIDQCTDEDANPYSDVAHFNAGITWAYASRGEWEKVK